MECLKPLYLHKHEISVPCGKCPQCGVNKRSEWATRLHYEARQHLHKKFVTLTYANQHLRWDHGQSQLDKRDLQLWFKRVRKTGAKIRYYAVGEYGSTTYRPHYHVLLFGDVSDDVIRSSWNLGLVHIGLVTQASVMYCLGYLVNAKAPLMNHHRVRPFSLMSRKPGLGASYLSPEMLEWHHSGRKNFTLVDGVERRLPRYYKTKIFSKIDQVRIAVTASKVWLQNQIEWSRRPEHMKMSYKQLLRYKRDQQIALAQKIRAHSKTAEKL